MVRLHQNISNAFNASLISIITDKNKIKLYPNLNKLNVKTIAEE